MSEEIKTRPGWDEYFMNIALAVSERSTCLRRKYGAVVVDTDNRIVSTGYNGAPAGEPNCIDIGVCDREEHNIPKGERYECCRAGSCHAEANAILRAQPQDRKGARIYIAGTNVADGTPANGKPCLLCERLIINSGIKDVIYYHPELNKLCFHHDFPHGEISLIDAETYECIGNYGPNVFNTIKMIKEMVESACSSINYNFGNSEQGGSSK